MTPINYNTFCCGTVRFWRSARKAYGARTWRGAMDRFALQHGKAIAMLANDDALIVEREDGGLTRHHLPATCVRWVNKGYNNSRDLT